MPLKFPRRIRVHPSRRADFKAGHRVAARGAVAWLHWYAATRGDPKAMAILNEAADALGCHFRNPPAARSGASAPR